jgi:hypothetical protein
MIANIIFLLLDKNIVMIINLGCVFIWFFYFGKFYGVKSYKPDE